MSGPLGFGDDPEPVALPDPEPESTPAPPPVPPPSDPTADRRRGYRWVVGVAVVLALGYITLNTLGTRHTGLQVGDTLPPFAAPLATGGPSADPNIASRGPHPACLVAGPRFAGQVLNLCIVTASKPLVLAVVTLHGDCQRQLDVMQRVRGEFPGVGFAGLVAGDSAATVAAAASKHGWSLPVAYDRHGDVVSLYGIVSCPAVLFVEPGRPGHRRVLQRLATTQLDAATLRAYVRQLQRAS